MKLTKKIIIILKIVSFQQADEERVSIYYTITAHIIT